eukprot:TRINITY_DN500_c9_g1_i1.p1 TRINITY_DN500_c9_g1~~TRINITY_DN500_c9_g1_i1.p1  ORF type:complete len:496 (+),score=103.70 TRINITY_DN500_c9_g1_i1:45-1490(+)
MSVSASTVIMSRNTRVLSTAHDFAAKFMNRMTPVESATLANGLRVATQGGGPNGFATIAMHSKTGSRFDTFEKQGVSAMVQRAMFHGTTTKTADQIHAEIKSLGGNIKFEQGRERQSVYINCLSRDAEKAVALLGDVAQNAKMDEAALNAARADALEGLKEAENCSAFDLKTRLYHQAYETTTRGASGSGLAFHPNGDAAHMKEVITADDLAEFYNRSFAPSDIAIVATGAVSSEGIVQAVEQSFGGLTKSSTNQTDKRYTGGHVKQDEKVCAPYSNHVTIGWEICGASSPDVIPLQLCMEMFGSYDRFHNERTRAFWIRYCNEFVSTQLGNEPLEEVLPIFETYSDTGIMGFHLQFKLGEGKIESLRYPAALQSEFIEYAMRLQDEKVVIGKNLLKSKVLADNDGCFTTNKTIGNQIISGGGVVPVEQSLQRIDDITTQQVSDTINHYYYDREPVVASRGLTWTLPIFPFIRRSMFKWRY